VGRDLSEALGAPPNNTPRDGCGRGVAAQPAPRCWSPTCRSARSAATEFYAEQALAAGCAFVNCIPVFIASNPDWQGRFEKRGLPIIGDDIKSQVGATIVHRVLANLFRERGVRLDRTYQLNFGGNSDFKNMLERERLESKKISKTQAVTSQFDVPLPPTTSMSAPATSCPG
jgi:myo-inositol-1-phosphate synthase